MGIAEGMGNRVSIFSAPAEMMASRLILIAVTAMDIHYQNWQSVLNNKDKYKDKDMDNHGHGHVLLGHGLKFILKGNKQFSSLGL